MGCRFVTFEEIPSSEDKNTIISLREVLEKCISGLTEAGATRYVCSASHKDTNEFNVAGGEFTLFRTLFSDGLSITAYVGNRKGSVSLNKFDDESIRQAVASCIDSAKAAEDDPNWVVAPKEECPIRLVGQPYGDTERFFQRVQEFVGDVERDYPLIMLEELVATLGHRMSVYRNSSGTELVSISGNYSLDVTFSAHDGDNASSFAGEGVITDNLDKPFMELSTISRSFADISRQIYTEPFEGKTVGTLVCMPSLFQEFLSTALESFAGDTNILNGTAIWKDKLGQKVADERLTLSITSNHPGIVCPGLFSGEGFRAQDYNILDKGVLTNFDLSAYTANKTGNRRAPNPVGNMVMEAGDKTLEEMIASVELGVLAARFSGGEPSVNGDFSGVAKNGFLIEHGKITKALSETMISGNLADALNNVIDISRETICDGNSVMPYVSIGNITISGK